MIDSFIPKNAGTGLWKGSIDNDAASGEGPLPVIMITYDSINRRKSYNVYYDGAEASTGAGYLGGWIKFLYFNRGTDTNTGGCQVTLTKQ